MSSHHTKGTSARSTEKPPSPGSFNIRVNPLYIVSLITMCGKNFDFRQPQILSIPICCLKTNPFHLFLRERDTFRASIIGNSCYTKLRSITEMKSSTGKVFSKRYPVIQHHSIHTHFFIPFQLCPRGIHDSPRCNTSLASPLALIIIHYFTVNQVVGSIILIQHIRYRDMRPWGYIILCCLKYKNIAAPYSSY